MHRLTDPETLEVLRGVRNPFILRYDLGIILYAPLRTAIYEDTDGRVHLSIDQPSSKFASFGDPRIATVGAQLDAPVAELLRLMSLPVPAELTTV